MDRREFLRTGLAAAAMTATSGGALADAIYTPAPGTWRSFELKTRIDLAAGGAPAQSWIPLPSFSAQDWMRPQPSRWSTNAEHARIVRDPARGGRMLHLVWAKSEAAPFVEIVDAARTRDRGAASRPARLSSQERRLYTAPTALIPTDGVVKKTADKIVAGLFTDEAKARAIYEWVVDHAYRKAATRGCGVGDVAAMLESGDLGGKCADINALYVGLVRSQGLPARDLYGLRVGKSRFGYKSLGANSEAVTKAQHCRAEVFLEARGWTAVDPADVRKVVLEEPPGNLALAEDKVAAARAALFGASEGNWIAYNVGHDIALPGAAASPRVDFLMYPQAEIAGVRCDCLDPDRFRYVITAKELAA
jgi:transglutaminase-like putative cysteine protease